MSTETVGYRLVCWHMLALTCPCCSQRAQDWWQTPLDYQTQAPRASADPPPSMHGCSIGFQERGFGSSLQVSVVGKILGSTWIKLLPLMVNIFVAEVWS